MLGEHVWDELGAEAPPGPGIVRRRVRGDSARNIFIGVAYPGGERVLELVVSTDAAADINLPNTRALTTVQADGAPGEVELRIMLAAPEMAGVFTRFCDDVIGAVAAAQSDPGAVRNLLERFAHWQRLFAAEGGGLSSIEAQALFGELWVLENLFLSLGGSQSIEAWRGPDREDRDFLVSGLGIEVKTTRADEPAAVTISNEAQLDVAGLDALYLVILKLEALRGGKGSTLNDSVDSILDALALEAVPLFRDRLLRYGYFDQHSDRYNGVVYVIREVAVFRVEEGFPRILEKDLVPGVGSVTYRLALSACEPWRRALDELHAAVKHAAWGARG